LFSGCKIGSEGCVALAGALQGHSALQSINLTGAWGIHCCVVWGVVCIFECLLIGDCFQCARLEAKAALRLLGRCKGTLHCRASISHVREWYFVFVECVVVCVIECLLIGGLFSDCHIGSEGCVALAGALQGHSALQSIDLGCAWGIHCCVVLECVVCMFECLLIGGLFSDCQIGNEGCVALAGALQGHSALQSINLECALAIFFCFVVWEMKLMRREGVVRFRFNFFLFFFLFSSQ